MSLCSSVGHKTIYAQDCTPTKLSAATKDDVSEEPLNQLKGPVAAREKERTTMPLSEPLSLYNNIVLGESGTHSFISTEDACDRRVDRSASKKRKLLHRKLLLPRRSEPLQSNVATEDFMHVRPSSENMELGADEEVKTCSVRETQRDEKQILHESAQTFGDAVSKTATQNGRIAKTLAEEQPIGLEKDRHFLGTVQQSRFVHNKLKMRPAAAGNSDGEHQIFLPNGMSGLAEIVCSAQPGNFEHCKLSQGSKPSETEVTTDASASREQLDMSRATEGWSEKPDSACVKESSTLTFCHSEFEGEGSYRSEGTLKSAQAEVCKTFRDGVTDGPSLPKGREGAASPESAHNPNAKSIATVQAEQKNTKMLKRKELPSEDSQADPLPSTEHPAPPKWWKVKWKDTTKRKTKCAPGAGVADVHDDRESPWDESGQDDFLSDEGPDENVLGERSTGLSSGSSFMVQHRHQRRPGRMLRNR
ncbi:hypothetical protein HPB47_004257 [Ixodes persulcatus]|uniref:Uncharacterized protein n=1 Tax=Ixodes persulcatus TaxID=34615 RepID=A0AC60PH53_IXOPE|nr:hypothetical protein HPB47_004257 [Ixodes persulcatus]